MRPAGRGGAEPEQPRTLAGRRYRAGAGAATAEVKSGSTPSSANMVATPIWQLNSWILPSRTYQKSAVGMSGLSPRRLDHAGGRLERPEEGAPDRQLDRDDVPEHVDPVQLPVNVGKQLAHPDDHIAQVLTPVALLARHTADAVEHTVLSEQIDEPLHVHDVALGRVVRAAHDGLCV